MLLTEVILRLRNACPMFEKRVAGTQSFVAATEQDAEISMPCAFVVPIGDYPAEKDPRSNSTAQRVMERFSVVVCADNSVGKISGRGLAAETVLKQARNELLNAFAGWNPIAYPYMDTIQYSRSMHLHMNEARIWHQYDWHAYYYVDGENTLSNDTFVMIDKIVNGNYPDVDPALIRKILMGKAPLVGVANEAQYIEILDLLQDQLPTWVEKRNQPFVNPLNDPQGHLFGENFELRGANE